jgi:hypothetical protein
MGSNGVEMLADSEARRMADPWMGIDERAPRQ